jgi:hypothetical protein
MEYMMRNHHTHQELTANAPSVVRHHSSGDPGTVAHAIRSARYEYEHRSGEAAEDDDDEFADDDDDDDDDDEDKDGDGNCS